MPINFSSPRFKNLAPRLLDDARLTKTEAKALLDGASATAATDAGRLLSAPGIHLTDGARELLAGFVATSGQPAALTTTSGLAQLRAGTVRGPEEPAKVGDVVAAPKITWTVNKVLSAMKSFASAEGQDPQLRIRTAHAPWPKTSAEQLQWAIAYERVDNKLEDPLWNTATNDSSAAATSFVHGVAQAQRAGVNLIGIEQRAAAAHASAQQMLAQSGNFDQLTSMPFPAQATDAEKLVWASLMQFHWDAAMHPDVKANAEAAALFALVGGFSAKKANNSSQTLVKSERRTLDVDGDTRMYAVHTPPGPKPAEGWPTVVFFHGSYGGHAPEQNKEYQALNAEADKEGFQVLYMVGTPQDRNDSSTGRGMLNWTPVGAGAGGKNDRFVHTLLSELIADGDVDKGQVIAAGHSQGGYYVSDLLSAYPDVFSGAAIFGSGAGAVMGQHGPRGTRRTPTYMFVGADDIHKQGGDNLAALLQQGGYGDVLTYDSPAGRGHEVLASDYARMFDVVGDKRHDATPLGTTTGLTMTGTEASQPPPTGPVFRPAIDLNNPPLELQNDPAAYSLMVQLAQNPWLQVDNNAASFGVDEWKQALRYIHTFPPMMQQEIARLRGYFVIAAPPRDAIDLSTTGSPLFADPEIGRALWLLQGEPAFDLDGYPGLVSEHEVDAALIFAPQLAADQVRGLQKLKRIFGPPTGGGVRDVQTLTGGAVLETYPGSDAAIANAKAIVDSLSLHPGLAKTLSETRLLVGPPGQSLGAVPEIDPHYADVEGLAMYKGPDGISGPKTLAIRHDSISRWDLGFAHEVLHLYLFDQGPAAEQEAKDILKTIIRPDAAPNGYTNHQEMFAFFGQWYLAGYGDVVKEKNPQLHAFLVEKLGDARVKDPGWGEDGARGAIDSLYTFFETGVDPHGHDH